ncbi:MAG: thioredoxin family protein [Planctomycetaceae bacterium]
MERPSRTRWPWAGLWLALACATGNPCAAGPGSAPFDPLGGAGAELASPVTITAAIEPGSAGGPDMLAVMATLEAGWHTYSLSQPAEGAVPTVIAVAMDSPRRVVGRFEPDRPPSRHEIPALKGVVLEEHAGTVTWRAALGPGGGDVRGKVTLQVCEENSCTPPRTIEFTAAAVAGGAAPPAGAAPPNVAAATPVVAVPADAARLTLPLALLSGLLGGLILNLMPCVLPVLGLKLMSFAQQSGRARRDVFTMNLWYCAGVYAVFMALATASVAANIGLASTNLGWGQQFQFVSFRIAMLGIVFAFALSFLGVWEIPIPGFIGEQAGHVQTKEGPLGSFLKGVLGTVLATPCSGPFLGPVFGFTLGAPTPVTYAVFGAIATGMALPYILVGLFPGLVRFMPKPGAWMATFKELLGFVMLGTVAYLFYMLRQQPVWFVPTFVMLIGIWMGCWWVGRLQERQGVVGFDRWVQATALASVIGGTGFLWLGPHVNVGGPEIAWEQPFTAAALAAHRATGATVLVDFTADWCPTCKTNIATAIETRKVADAIRDNRVVPILADFTDRSPEIDRFLSSMGSRSIPFLVIFPGTKPGEPPRDPIVLRDAITEPQLLAALEQAGPSCCPPPEIRSAAAGTAPPGR